MWPERLVWLVIKGIRPVIIHSLSCRSKPVLLSVWGTQGKTFGGMLVVQPFGSHWLPLTLCPYNGGQWEARHVWIDLNFLQRLKGKHLCLISNKIYCVCLHCNIFADFSPTQAEMRWDVTWPSLTSSRVGWEGVESRWRERPAVSSGCTDVQKEGLVCVGPCLAALTQSALEAINPEWLSLTVLNCFSWWCHFFFSSWVCLSGLCFYKPVDCYWN